MEERAGTHCGSPIAEGAVGKARVGSLPDRRVYAKMGISAERFP